MLHSAISRLLRPSSPHPTAVAAPEPAAETVEKPSETAVCNTVTPAGETLVADLMSFLARYLVCSDHQRLVLALWIIHTHCSSAAQYTPYLDIRSASKQSGKSLCLQLLKFLCRESMLTCGLTATLLSERLATNSATLLLDEREATVGSLQSSRNPALRAMLACGFQYGATHSHRSGDRTIYSPKAFAGTASLPESLAERCIPIDLEPGRPTHRFRRQAVEKASALRQLLEQWAKDNLAALESGDACSPADFPQALSMRQQDCIEPLLQIADRIGADWGTKAREALLALFHQRLKLERRQGVLLLRAVCEAFVLHKFPERLSSQDILIWLHTREHRPWDRETPITAQRLATELHPFNVGPRLQRVGNRVARGYRVEDVKAAYHNFLEAEEESRVAKEQSDVVTTGQTNHPVVTGGFPDQTPEVRKKPAPARRTSQGKEYAPLYDREWLEFINNTGYEPIPPDDTRPAAIHIGGDLFQQQYGLQFHFGNYLSQNGND